MKQMVTRNLRVCIVVIALILTATGLLSCAKKNGILCEINITPDSPSVASGYSLQLTAHGVLSDGVTYDMTSLTWISSNAAIAQVDEHGLVTAGSATGMVTITATENDSHKNITGIVVIEVASIQAIIVTPANPGMAINTTHQFNATATLSNGVTQDLTSSPASALIWTTSSPDVATVFSTPGFAGSGVVTAGATAGQTYVTATDLFSNITGSTPLMVTNAALDSVAVIVADASAPGYIAGPNLQLMATATYADDTQMNRTLSMTWSSSNTEIAMVSDSGVISTQTITGNVTIKASDPITGKSGQMVVTIN